jgi:hypothetical protein
MIGSRAGTALGVKLALTAPALRAAAADLWLRPGLRHRYPLYLRAMHAVIRASVPLMELAERRCAELGADDPVARPLRRYLLEHIDEERGHDDWLLADLAVLGDNADRWLHRSPPPVVARLVGAQYYWVSHHHPVALLGYIAVMEGNAPAPSLADWIVARADIPAAAVRTVRDHAELDVAHGAAVVDLLDRLPLTDGQSGAVATAALYTVDGLVALYGHLAHADIGKGDPP